MNLSPHFTYEEMTDSQVAARNGLDNTPSPAVLENLKFTCQNLEYVKALLNDLPILISSGYRSPAVNKAAGSVAKHSQHMEGQAADFKCPKFGTPRQIVEKIKASNIQYDQLILEFDSWVHISFVKTGSRKQVLVIDSNGTRNFS